MTAPTIRGTWGSAAATAANNVTATYPGGIQPGDVGYAVVGANTTTLSLTGLSGWSIIGSQLINGTTLSTYLITKDMDGTETGTLTITFGSSPRGIFAGIIVGPANDALTVMTNPGTADTTSNTTAAGPAITPAADDCLDVILAASRFASSATVGSFNSVAGFNEDRDVTDATAGTAIRFNAYVADKPLVGQNGVAQSAFSATTTVAATNNIYRLAIPLLGLPDLVMASPIGA